ncbi:hypothetical protein HK405_004510 [Cladochytrium tenue]|nr:hypothetical protein HK405_004510 [Cladochytrium tenue]
MIVITNHTTIALNVIAGTPFGLGRVYELNGRCWGLKPGKKYEINCELGRVVRAWAYSEESRISDTAFAVYNLYTVGSTILTAVTIVHGVGSAVGHVIAGSTVHAVGTHGSAAAAASTLSHSTTASAAHALNSHMAAILATPLQHAGSIPGLADLVFKDAVTFAADFVLAWMHGAVGCHTMAASVVDFVYAHSDVWIATFANLGELMRHLVQKIATHLQGRLENRGKDVTFKFFFNRTVKIGVVRHHVHAWHGIRELAITGGPSFEISSDGPVIRIQPTRSWDLMITEIH